MENAYDPNKDEDLAAFERYIYRRDRKAKIGVALVVLVGGTLMFCLIGGGLSALIHALTR